VLERSISRIEVGAEGYVRALFATSSSHVVAALEVVHNDGPWVHPDDFRKVNGVLRYSQGDSINGFSLTAMGYHGAWNSTDQIPDRAIRSGSVSRYGSIDPSDGGHSYRYSATGDWQWGSGNGNASTRVTAYGLGYDLDLFSNVTYDLDDSVHGDQIEQADHRFVTGAKVSHRRLARWHGRLVQNTFGAQVRNGDITNLGLYHTQARARLETRGQAAVLETGAGAYAQNEVEWSPWLRTILGLRGDAARFHVRGIGASGVINHGIDPANTGTSTAELASPKAGVAVGPWNGTEFYVNAGMGYHSNDARGTTIHFDPDGNPVQPVTPLVRAKGAEVGVRTVVVRHLQSTVAVWTLHLDSELAFSGDKGTTEPTGPSARRGVEWANYYSPTPGLVFDADVSWSRARFTAFNPAGQYVPEAVGTVVSAGATVDSFHRGFGSLRWRYFGPRALTEDNSVRSNRTSLVNLQGGYRLSRRLKMAVDVFNLFDAPDSDIDYFYRSRLPGEPLGGVDDIHTHPTLPRTARVNMVIGF
jgi:hypothetical protein